MLIEDNFFKSNFYNSSDFKKNLKKTKKVFNSLLSSIESNDIPLLKSFEKDYEFDFSQSMVKKFSKYENIFVIGMGGSILGTKSIYSFLKEKIKKKVFFFDNLDSNLYLKYKKKNLKNSCFIVVSKSGNTLETIVNLGVIFSKKLLKNKLIVITEINDSNLMKIAEEHKADVVEHKEFIGGRFSVLSESAMLPAALMGLKLSKFKNLKMLLKNKNFKLNLIKSATCIYTLSMKGINNFVILSYDSCLNNLAYWYQQLIAESLGKEGRGLYPTISFAPKDHHSLFQLYLDGPRDKFFTFFNPSKIKSEYKINKNIFKNKHYLKNKSSEKVIKAQCDAAKKVFKAKGIPFRQFTFNNRNEKELGEIFTFFVLETILLAGIMKVNPFDQPAVEQIKIETKKFLK